MALSPQRSFGAIVLGLVCIIGLGFARPAGAQDVMHAEHHGETDHPVFDEGDLVAVIGNTFAVRMQRFSLIETLISARLPQHELRFRYLGRSGDEVAMRPRPLKFGDLHTHLRDVEADVILACFGLNEAFRGMDHLETFRSNLAGFVDTLRTTAYNGERPPQVVLVSPIAHEDLERIPADAEAHNRSLEAYSEAMAEYAGRHDNVRYVDLFHPFRSLMSEAATPTLTVNEVHLSEYGYWVASQIVGKALGLAPRLPRIVLDAQAEEAVGEETPVYNVVPEGPGMAFRVSQPARALPPPPGGREAPASLDGLDPVVEIRNLPAGRHVLEVKGKVVAEADSAEWARGVSLDVQTDALRRIHETTHRKNELWFYRYRAVNGEYIYGRRRKPFGVHNFPGEFRKLEMMVESTEHRLWSQVKDLLYLRWRIHAAPARSEASAHSAASPP